MARKQKAMTPTNALVGHWSSATARIESTSTSSPCVRRPSRCGGVDVRLRLLGRVRGPVRFEDERRFLRRAGGEHHDESVGRPSRMDDINPCDESDVKMMSETSGVFCCSAAQNE